MALTSLGVAAATPLEEPLLLFTLASGLWFFACGAEHLRRVRGVLHAWGVEWCSVEGVMPTPATAVTGFLDEVNAMAALDTAGYRFTWHCDQPRARPAGRPGALHGFPVRDPVPFSG